jgi:outer membrane receptor protein involved in Fe transport
MSAKYVFGWICLFLFLLSQASVSCAQGIDGTMRGDVKDKSGAVVPGASVSVSREGAGEARSTQTSAVGVFHIPNLLPGTYTVTVEMQGFQKHIRRGVQLQANQIAEVGVVLELGTPETVVEVVGGAELVQTTSAQLGGSFESRLVQDLPSAVLDVNNLAILAPGVSTQSGGVTGYGGAIGGNRPRNNNFVIDGVDNNDVSVTGPLQVPIPEAVSEFTLLTNQFTAEYGHSTAGQFLTTTQSGTNNVRGQFFGFLQNRRLNAFDPLDKRAFLQGDITGKPRYDKTRVGATAGGPIIKDKLFIFGAYQFYNIGRAATPGSTIFVPTSSGFATLDQLASSSGSGVKSSIVNLIKTYVPPATNQTQTVDIQREDTGLLVPVGVGPVTPSAPDYENQHDYMINPDFVTKRHRVSGRFQYTRIRSPYIAAFPSEAFTAFFANDQRNLAISDAFTISPTMVNDFRLGYRRDIVSYPIPNPPAVPSGLDVFPNFIVQDLNLELGPNGNLPQGGGQNNYQIVDNLTMIRGRHTFKFGGELRFWVAPSDFLPRARAEYNYNTLSTFVKDYSPGFLGLRGVGSGFFAGNQKAVYSYIQDDWKVTPNLTLNLGLRYEWTSQPRDAATQTLNAISTLPGTPLIFDKPQSDKNNWGPRIGFAWDVFGDRKTSLRGGFAWAYDQVFQNLPLLQLPPQLQQELDLDTACSLSPAPAYCATLDQRGLEDRGGLGFIAGGGIRPIPIPPITQADARAATQGLILKNTAPESYTYSLALQRELRPDLAVEFRYVGTRGVHLPVQVRLNARKDIGVIGQFIPTYLNASEVPGVVPATAPTLAGLQAQSTRTYSAFGFLSNLTAFPPIGNSIYHGGSVELTKRMSSGLMLKANYTWSKAIDDSTNELFTSIVNPRRPQSHTNLRPERGLSAIHHEHHLATSWVWDLPRFRHSAVLDKFLGGWVSTGTFLAETGQFVTPLSFADANLNGDTAGDRAIVNPSGSGLTVTGVNRVCANASGATSIAGTCPSGSSVVGYVAINPNARFVQAQLGTRANSGRNILETAGINNWNMGIFKNTYISETKFIQFRIDMVNVFNHRQPSLGLGTVEEYTDAAINTPDLVGVRTTNPNFGNSAALLSGGNRTITLGLKIFF